MRRGLLWLPAAFLAVAFFRPLFATLSSADADAWAWLLQSAYVHDRLLGAFWMALLSVALTLLLALPLAWLHHTRRIRFGRIQLALHAAPFVLPVFVVVFGVQATLGAGGWLEGATGIDALATLGPLGAVVIAHAYYNYGFAARLLHATLERRPHRLEAAARLLGAGPRQAFLRTSLPLLAPSIISVALLVFLFCFASFGVVLYMGGGQWETLETLLYGELRGAFPHPERAAALGILQLISNFLLLGAYQYLIRRQRRLPREQSRAPVAQGAATWTSWATVAIGLLPALAVLVGGFQVQGAWSLEAWRALSDADHPAHLGGFDLWHALRRSLFYAAASATIALLLTAALGYGVRGMRPWARFAAETIAALPLGTSSLLIGFGITLTAGLSVLLDSTWAPWVIVAAHALVGFPFAARALLPALQQHDVRLDEAAALLGAPSWDVVRRIHVPLLRGPLVAALGMAVAMSLGDFGASLLLMSAENRGISIWIDAHGISSFNPIMRSQAIALSGLLMALASAAYVAVEAVE